MKGETAQRSAERFRRVVNAPSPAPMHAPHVKSMHQVGAGGCERVEMETGQILALAPRATSAE